MKHILSLLLALPLLFVSCEEPTPEQPDVVTFKLTSAANVSFAAEGGEGVITYELTNATDLTPLNAEAADAWVTINTVGAEIAYSVAANALNEARTTTIVVSYNDLSGEVTIKQEAAAVAPKPSIEGWGIVGSITNNWDLQSVIIMPLENGYYAAKGIELTATDSFKFVKDGSYSDNRGGTGLAAEVNYSYNAMKGGSDIRVKEDGRYDIYLNEGLNTYYIMGEGVDPKDATSSTKPSEVEWYIIANDTKTKMTSQNKFLVAQDVVFGEDMSFKLTNSNDYVYGAEGIGELNTAIAVTSGKDAIAINGVVGTKYDIYFNQADSLIYVVEDGQKPIEDIKWSRIEGVAFDTRNFALFFISQKLILNFDFNCGVDAVNAVIPEGTYYVKAHDGDNGYNFNTEYCNVKVNGVEQLIHEGTMVVSHISGGYDIIVDVTTSLLENIRVRYTGPVVGNPNMGRYVTNPE